MGAACCLPLALRLPTAWVAFWLALAAATVALTVLLRTRWSHLRPWHKCALLSLWVHVLLACLAMTVNIVSGRPGVGLAVPIRVLVTADPAVAVELAEPPEPRDDASPVDPPPTDGAEAAARNAPGGAASDPSTPLAAPPLLAVAPAAAEATPEPSPPTPSAEASAASPSEAPPEAAVASAPDDSAAASRVAADPPPAAAPRDDATSSPAAPRPAEVAAAQGDAAASAAQLPADPWRAAEDATWTASGAPPRRPAVYARRFSERRAEWVVQRGGHAETERSVRSALAWLAGAQSPAGLWSAAQFGAGQERKVLGHDRRGAGAEADTGVTGLALLAFLGAGHTHREGDFVPQVDHALRALVGAQRADGALFGDARFFAQMYCHSMATFALCEAYALTGDRALRQPAEAAVGFTLRAQHPNDGGWRYQPGDPGDTSQLGWQLMALRSAELAGIEVPDVVWTRVERFLRRVSRGAHGGLGAYRPDGPPSRSMTAEAFYCRQLAALHAGAPLDPLASREAIESVLRELPDDSHRPNEYYWYYATLALNGARDQWVEASPAWDRWNHALTTTLLQLQSDDGSWPSDTMWGGYGGRVYTTALGALMLEVYYRYDMRAETPANVAERPDASPRR